MRMRLKIAMVITAGLCVVVWLFGQPFGTLSSISGQWSILQEKDNTIHSWGGKGRVNINDQQYDVEGRAIVQGGEEGSIKVEAGWHKLQQEEHPSLKKADLKLKVTGNKENPNVFQQHLTNHGMGGGYLPLGDTIGEDGGEGQDLTDEEKAWLDQVERILNGDEFDHPFDWRGAKDAMQQKANSNDVQPSCFDSNPEHFSLSRIVHNFKDVTTKDAGINTAKYLHSYSELMKLLDMLGTVFSFVTSDAKSKIEILEAYRASEQGEHYTTIESMLQYEKDTGIVLNNDKPSGARTLLRLHRALKFIMEFMHRMGKSSSDAKVSTMASECYHETLANYHVWFVRKAAGIAFYTLPTRKSFLEKLCKEEEDVVLGMISELAAAILPVYDQTEELYTKFDFHELP